jgi:ABC-type metal ion transport system substrate-binding protein
VARPDHAKDPRLLAFIKIFQSEDEKSFIPTHYEGAITPAW